MTEITYRDLEDMKRLSNEAKERGDLRLYDLLRKGFAASLLYRVMAHR